MKDYSQVPIIQCTYQLALECQRIAANAPKSYRHQVGDRLANATLNLFEGTARANFLKQATPRLEALDCLAAQLFTLQMTGRMAKDLKIMSQGQFTEFSTRVADIKKQLAGWAKWTKTKMLDHQPDESLS